MTESRLPPVPPTVRTVWFHRDYQRFTGGHVKHAHYFEHVRLARGFSPRMTFTSDGQPDSLKATNATLLAERAALWNAEALCLPDWTPHDRDILFVAGTDWRYVDASGLDHLPNPRINFLQHVRHAHAGTELFSYLKRRAVRICVSEEVASAVAATGRVNGPILAIPNGIDMTPTSRPHDEPPRQRSVLVVGYKEPDLARALSATLHKRGVRHELLLDFLEREAFLASLAETEVAVCLPRAEEGFYLPALEAMAAGCITVTMDCIGNRSFCLDGDNCLIGADAETLAEQVARAVALPANTRASFQASAVQTVTDHALAGERTRFHAVLADVDRLWELDGRLALPKPDQARHKTPLVDFMIVGAQKSGTTALAQFLNQHPAIEMASRKEVHLFDSPKHVRGTKAAEIDERYRPLYQAGASDRCRGEATPIYMHLPGIAAELRRYNPALKVIVLLRNPVDRAVSDYYMQRERGRESLPLWLALLLERWRLWRERQPFRERSAWREHAYRRRGLYSLQLATLLDAFDPEQLLVLRSKDLLERHDDTLRQVLNFLGVDSGVRIPEAEVFAGGPRRRHRVVRALLRLSLQPEKRRLGRMGFAW